MLRVHAFAIAQRARRVRSTSEVLTASRRENWCPRPELNRDHTFRKRALYPFELRGLGLSISTNALKTAASRIADKESVNALQQRLVRRHPN